MVTPEPTNATLTDQPAEVAPAAAPKPKLRGWIHAVMTPLVVAAVIVLISISPTTGAAVSSVIFGASAMSLFGVSAFYHLGNWSPRTTAVLRRIDHTNIFLIIAGSYTPLAVLLLEESTARVLLIVVWTGAILGLLARIFWLNAPRWLYTPIYVALGWVAIGFLPTFYRTGGATVMWLVIAGGLSYTLGAVVYALKWPNPSPKWFGFHEVFHLFTVGGFVSHLIAVYFAVLAAS